jgi:hypothetical protein
MSVEKKIFKIIDKYSDKGQYDTKDFLINIYQDIIYTKLYVLSWIIHLLSKNSESGEIENETNIRDLVEQHSLDSVLCSLKIYISNEFSYVNNLLKKNNIKFRLTKNILRPNNEEMLADEEVNNIFKYYVDLYFYNKLPIKAKESIKPVYHDYPEERYDRIEYGHTFEKKVMEEPVVGPQTYVQKLDQKLNLWYQNVKDNPTLAGHHEIINSLTDILQQKKSFEINLTELHKLWDKIYFVSIKLDSIHKKSNEVLISYAIKLFCHPRISFRVLHHALQSYLVSKNNNKAIKLYDKDTFTPSSVITEFYDNVFENNTDPVLADYKKNHICNKIILYDCEDLIKFIEENKSFVLSKKDLAIKTVRKTMKEILVDQIENQIEWIESRVFTKVHESIRNIIRIKKGEVEKNIRIIEK